MSGIISCSWNMEFDEYCCICLFIYVSFYKSKTLEAMLCCECIDRMLSDLTVSDTECVCVCGVIRAWRSPSRSAQQLANLRLWTLKAICPLFLSSTLTCTLIQTHYLLKVSSCSVGMLLCVWFITETLSTLTWWGSVSQCVCRQRSCSIFLHETFRLVWVQ